MCCAKKQLTTSGFLYLPKNWCKWLVGQTYIYDEWYQVILKNVFFKRALAERAAERSTNTTSRFYEDILNGHRGLNWYIGTITQSHKDTYKWDISLLTLFINPMDYSLFNKISKYITHKNAQKHQKSLFGTTPVRLETFSCPRDWQRLNVWGCLCGISRPV